jgi:hypothetical protein
MKHDSTIHHSPSTARQSSAPLRLFTQPSVIKEIGYDRLFRFFRHFATDLQSAEIPWPDFRPGDDEFYVNLARLLNLTSFPQSPRSVLDRLERLAAPENRPLLDSIFVQQLSHVTIPTTSPALHRALELWFLSPQLVTDLTDSLLEPSSLAAPKPSEGGLAASTCHVVALAKTEADEGGLAAPNSAEQPLVPSAPIEIRNSKFENDPDPCSSVSNGGPPSGPIENQNSSPRETLAPCDEKLSNPGASIPACLTGAKIENASIQHPAPTLDSDGAALLSDLASLLNRFVVLPKHAAETLALWIVHTHAFQLRDVSTYIGIESPEPRCGKTTLLTVLAEICHRALPASNISPPAFFRVIEDMSPTLLIDEADTFLHRNEQLQGILNAGYKKKTAFVWRVAYDTNSSSSSSSSSKSPCSDSTVRPVNGSTPAQLSPDSQPSTPNDQPSTTSQLASFSVWCPKVISQIGRLPATLADRCIVIRMQRKTADEQCDRLRDIDDHVASLKERCAKFVADNQDRIAGARPPIPQALSDRAADIWEPLFVLADLAGPEWSERARHAAVGLAAAAHDSNPIASLLLDILVAFCVSQIDRMFSRDLVDYLNHCRDHPWLEVVDGKPITDRWLSRQLRPLRHPPQNSLDQRPGGQRLPQRRFRRCLPPLHLQIRLRSPAYRMGPAFEARKRGGRCEPAS